MHGFSHHTDMAFYDIMLKKFLLFLNEVSNLIKAFSRRRDYVTMSNIYNISAYPLGIPGEFFSLKCETPNEMLRI